jgi:hypothetical protein
MKRSLFITLFMGWALFASAQVTIGSGDVPLKGALLQLKEKEVSNDDSNSGRGLALPRVRLSSKANLFPMFYNNPDVPASGVQPSYISNKTALDKQHSGLTVYNVATDASEGLEPGVYVWNGSQWKLVGKASSPQPPTPSSPPLKFFYMPSFNLPVPYAGVHYFNLYEEYRRQFTKQGNNTFISSNNSLDEVPSVYQADQLDYIVTYYDKSVIDVIQITPEGVMAYAVYSTTIPSGAFINIVLAVK